MHGDCGLDQKENPTVLSPTVSKIGITTLAFSSKSGHTCPFPIFTFLHPWMRVVISSFPHSSTMPDPRSEKWWVFRREEQRNLTLEGVREEIRWVRGFQAKHYMDSHFKGKLPAPSAYHWVISGNSQRRLERAYDQFLHPLLQFSY